MEEFMQLRACHDDFARSAPRSPHHRPEQNLQKLRTTVACAKGQEICPPDCLNAYWWQVETGAARKVLLLPSGQRCIMEFFFPGDFFACHTYGCADIVVEAICEGTVLGRYKRVDIERLTREDSNIARMLRHADVCAAFHMETHILNLWHQRSIDKLLAFLTQIQKRQRRNEFISLPMGRQDIADYLGLSVETVSRALTELKEHGILEFDGTRKLKIAPQAYDFLSLPTNANSNQLMTAA